MRVGVCTRAGQQTREMLLHEPWLTAVDPTITPRPWVKWAYEPVRAQDVPAAMVRAFAVASAPPQGPVFLSLPLDDWSRPAEDSFPIRKVSTTVAPEGGAISALAEELRAAANPVLVLGGSVERLGGWDAALRVAELLQLPVWSAPSPERISLPEDHPLYRGRLTFSPAKLADELAGHDLVAVFGAQVFRYYPYERAPALPAGARLRQVTDSPDEAAKAVVGDAIIGDPALALGMLGEQLSGFEPSWSPPPPRPAPPPPVAGGGELSADQLFERLAALAPAATVLVEESPSNSSDLARRWPIRQPASFYTFASGALG